MDSEKAEDLRSSTLKLSTYNKESIDYMFEKEEEEDESSRFFNHIKNNTGVFTIVEFIIWIGLSVIYCIAYNHETKTLKDPKTGKMELSEKELYIKHMILAAVGLKTVLYFLFNISTCFIKNGGSDTELARSCCWRGCTKKTSNTILKYGLYQLAPFLYFPWWIFVLYKYHTYLYNCGNSWTEMIKIGLMVMVVEAYCYIIFYAFFFIVLALVTILLWRISAKHRNKLLKIEKSIKDIVLVKLSGINYEGASAGDSLEFARDNYTCCIWTEDFKNVDDISQLPWDQKHVFHKKWLSDWLEMCKVCPCCKAYVT